MIRKPVSSSMLWRAPFVQETCPICRLDDGFHDHRDLVEVPRELLKEKDWHKKCDPEKGFHATPHRDCILR